MRRVLPVLALLATATVFTILNERFRLADDGYDEQFFVWAGWCLRKGLHPYRDFVEYKAPMSFVVHGIAQSLFGFEGFGYRWMFLFFPLASVLTLQLAMFRRGLDVVMSSALCLALTLIWVHPAYHDTALSDPESVGAAFAIFGIAALLSGLPWHGGALLACAAASKEPYLLICIGLAWLLAPKDWRSVLYGAITVAGVLVLWLAIIGSLLPYISMASHYARMYRGPLAYCVQLGLVHPVGFWTDLYVQWQKARAAYLNLDTLWPTLPLVGAALMGTKKMRWAIPFTLAAGLWAVTASNCQWSHYYTMTTVAIFGVLVATVPQGPMTIPFWQTLAVVFVGLAVYERLDVELRLPHERHVPDPTMTHIRQFIRDTTLPTDHIWTLGPPSLYPYTDRMSATRESGWTDELLVAYDGETDVERLAPVRAELERNRPAVIYLDPEHGNRKGRIVSALVLPFLRDYGYRQVEPLLFVRPQ
jgi:hypothetical protein